MKEFWIDFSGYLRVKAENADDAERKMLKLINEKFNLTEDFSNDVWNIEYVEEYEEGVY